MTSGTAGSGTAGDPWILATPPGKSDFEAWRDPDSDPPALVVQVGSTQLRYQLRCIEDLHAMLKERGDWVPLGGALHHVRFTRAAGAFSAQDRECAGLLAKRLGLVVELAG